MNNRPSFEEIFLNLAKSLALRSHCVRKKVGAVLTKENRIVSIGYNGPPAGTYNCDEKWPQTGCKPQYNGGCSLAVHAEENAIIYATKEKISLENTILYITLSPCLPCARLIFSCGIKKVIFIDKYSDYKPTATEEGIEFLQEFGVIVEQSKI